MEPPSYLSLSRAHHGLVDRDTIQKRDGFINRRKLLLDYILRIAGFQPAHICWRVVVFIYFLLTTCISGYLGYYHHANHTMCSFYSATIFSLQLQSFILYCTGYFILNNSFKERLVNNLPEITADFKLILQKEFLWTTCIISLSYFSGAFIFVAQGMEPLTFAYTVITNIFDVIRYLPLITIIALIRSFYRPFLYRIQHIRQQHGIWSNYNSTLESHMYQCDIEDIKKDINAILQDYRNMMLKKRFTLWISIYMFCNIISIILFWASILSSNCSQTKKEMWPHYVHYTTELVVYFFAWIFLIFPMYRCDKALSSLVADIITKIEYYGYEYIATVLYLHEIVNQSIFSVGNWKITFNRLAKILLFVSLTVTFDVVQTEAESWSCTDGSFSILIGVFLFLYLLLVAVDILIRYFANRAVQNIMRTHQEQSIYQNTKIQNRIRNALTAVEQLFNLVNQTWSSNDPSLIIEYTTGNGANGSSSSNQSDKSGESKRNNDGQQGNNSNERKYNDDNHNDNNERKDNNSDENEDGSCITHEYNCGVSWHAVRLKQLEEENWKLKSLLQKQTVTETSIDATESKTQESLNKNTAPVINLKTTKKLTKKEIPDRIAESFCDVADYMNKYVHIYRETAIQDYTYDGKDIKVIDYGFHCKKTLETLYGVYVKNVQTETNDILWKTVESLYCASKLQEIYNIQNLSFSVNISDQILTEIKHAKEQVSQLLQNQKQRDNIIRNKNTPWGNQDNIPIVNKPSKQTGLTLVLEKHEFVE
eukprot:446781_1